MMMNRPLRFAVAVAVLALVGCAGPGFDYRPPAAALQARNNARVVFVASAWALSDDAFAAHVRAPSAADAVPAGNALLAAGLKGLGAAQLFGFIAVALAAVAGLLLKEPDLGAVIVVVAISMGILFLGGINAHIFSGIALLLTSAFALIIWLSPFRTRRIFAYLDPWNPENVLKDSYQLSHSLVAIGRGQWTGVGLGGSVEKLHYLPEAHTDFIMAVIGEELGFVGILLMITLFGVLVHRCIEIGRQAIAMERPFGGLVSQGVGIWFGVQSFINIGVCLGLLPTKGLTLPLVSYGGTGIVMNLCAIALVLRVDFENRNMMRGVRS